MRVRTSPGLEPDMTRRVTLALAVSTLLAVGCRQSPGVSTAELNKALVRR